MANTVQTDLVTAAQVYSDQFIEGISLALEPISMFSTDFSAALINSPGETVVFPLVMPDTASEWNDTTNNYTRPVASLKDASVTINKHPITGFAIKPLQVATFQPSYWQGRARLNARSVGLSVVKEVFGLVTATNFPKSETVAAATFKKNVVAALRALAVNNNMAPGSTVVVLNPVYFALLLADLDASVYGGPEAIRNGHIPGLFGFRDIVEAPNYAGPGFLAYPSALAVASRVLRPLRTEGYDVFETHQDDATGFAFNTVVSTELGTGRTSMAVDCNFGAAVGDKGETGRETLIRLVEATPPG